MKRVVLSTGDVINAYSGDGFDGGSSFYVERVNRHGPEAGLNVVVPDRDVRRVIALLKWWIAEEMDSRLGDNCGLFKYGKEPAVIPESMRGVFEAQYWLGALIDRTKSGHFRGEK